MTHPIKNNTPPPPLLPSHVSLFFFFSLSFFFSFLLILPSIFFYIGLVRTVSQYLTCWRVYHFTNRPTDRPPLRHFSHAINLLYRTHPRISLCTAQIFLCPSFIQLKYSLVHLHQLLTTNVNLVITYFSILISNCNNIKLLLFLNLVAVIVQSVF